MGVTTTLVIISSITPMTPWSAECVPGVVVFVDRPGHTLCLRANKNSVRVEP